jgi:hypothetical protein
MAEMKKIPIFQGLSRPVVYDLLIFSALLIFFSIIAFLSEGSHGGGDDLAHYRLARYAFQFPEFFLDHWGKPVFTILASPFAQFGIMGVRIFNVLAALTSAFFVYRTLQILKFSTAHMGIAFVLLAPVFTALIPSSMTEIIAAALLSVSVWAYFSNKYILSAILIGFLPFARLEGILIVGCFGLVFLLARRWKPMMFLFFGFILFSLVGIPVFGDFFWFFNHIPYSSASASIYGKGSLWYYFDNMKSIVGLPVAAFFSTGLLVWAVKMWKGNSEERRNETSYLLLIILPIFLIIAFHSLTWYFGTGALALRRFMALIVPLFAIGAVRGYEVIESFITFRKSIVVILLRIGLVVLLWTTVLSFYSLPVKYSPMEITIKEACNWIKSEGLLGRPVFFYDHYVSFFLDKNPFDPRQSRERVYHVSQPSKDIPTGALVVWDSQFAESHGNLSFESLSRCPDLRLIKSFTVDQTKNPETLYEVHVFEKFDANP